MTRKKASKPAPKEKSDKDPTISALFVFGVDETGQTRGARFLEAKPEIEAAAQDLQLRVVKNPTGAFAELAMRLPIGRMYASGKAFIPNVRADLHAKLVEAEKSAFQVTDALAAGIQPEALDNLTGIPDNGPRAPLPTYPQLPDDWQSIEVGHLVLLNGGATVGHWEAVVIELQQNILTLRLRDYPEQGTFLRHRYSVALLNPCKTSDHQTEPASQ